jgi:type I restriction enzyme, S subunit
MTVATKTIPKGYKQTEIGVIPTDWDVKTLGDLGNVKMCRRIFNHETNKTGLIPFYKIGTFGKEADAYISQNLYEEYRRRFSFPKKGDILISAAGTIGRTIVYDGTPSYFQDSNIVWIDNDESLVSNQYLNYIFEVAKYNTEGGTIQRLYNSILSNTKFICPTEAEQESIATALSNIDALIQKTESLIEKKKVIKQGAMQELLTGKRRLPGFNAEWQDVVLEDVISQFTTGLNPRQNFQLNNGGDIFYVTIKNFSNGKLLLDDKCDMVDGEAFIKINNRSDLKKDDLLFVSIGRVGDVYLIPEDPINWNINESVFSLRPNQKRVVPKFLYHILTDEKIRKLLDLGITGSTFKSIKMADLRKIPSVIPKDKQEQTAIATILSDMDTEIEKLESELTKWRDMKQGMMQTLLTGKIRLIK